MSELLPCPFCGGEADVIDYDDECRVAHQCANGTSVETNSYATESEAIAAWNSRADYHGYEQAAIEAWESIKAWNSRAERTCEFISSKGSDYPPVCSACGYELGIYDCEWFEDGTYGYGGNYCPNCGCKVVGE